MATPIVMPRLGWTMEEGSLVEWLKHDGDPVQAGEIIFTVESDKAVNEIESVESGVLRIPPDSPAPGVMVPVGGVMAYLVQPGEPAPFETSQAASHVQEGQASNLTVNSDQAQTQSATNGSAGSIERTTGRPTPTISPRARRIAADLSIDWLTIVGSGRTGRIVERDIRAAAAAESQHATLATEVPAARVTPVARRLAQELNVDLNALSASLPGKRIDRADVENAAANVQTIHVPSASQPDQPIESTGVVMRTPISHMRKIIAERMAASAHTTAPVTLTTEADATELVRLRKQFQADSQISKRPPPSYNDLLVKLCGTALVEHRLLNARFEGEMIVQPEDVHIGLAVDSDRGLVVPVIRNVQNKTLRQIVVEAAALVESARAAALGPDAMQGATFTITNLGMYEIDAFTPIINLPQCAILGVGRIVAKQVVIDAETEQVAIRQMVFLSLTFDHRLVDGAPAARFMQRIKRLVEQPYLGLA